MIRFFHRNNFFVCFFATILLCNQSVFCQDKKEKFLQFAIYAGPGLSIYSINTKHADNLKSKPTFNAGIKCLLTLNKSTYFFTSLQIITHGNSFNSYYFADSTLKLYDKNYNYNYNSKFTDFSVNAGLRYKFTENHQTKSKIYGELACILKQRIGGLLDLSSISYGNSVYYDTPGNNFSIGKNSNKNAFGVLLASGFDKNFRDKKSAWFVEINFQYCINRFDFIKKEEFPKDLFQNERFLLLNTGIRF